MGASMKRSKTYKRVKLEDGIISFDCLKCGHSDLGLVSAKSHSEDHRRKEIQNDIVKVARSMGLL